MRRLACFVISIVAVVPGTAFGRAASANLTGTAKDSSGAVLPGVTITLQSAEALGQFSAVSDDRGEYRVTNVPPATYEIRAELTGFQTVVRRAPVRLNGVTQIPITQRLNDAKTQSSRTVTPGCTSACMVLPASHQGARGTGAALQLQFGLSPNPVAS